MMKIGVDELERGIHAFKDLTNRYVGKSPDDFKKMGFKKPDGDMMNHLVYKLKNAIENSRINVIRLSLNEMSTFTSMEVISNTIRNNIVDLKERL